MKDKKIIKAIQNAILNDLRSFEEAMDTCSPEDYKIMVQDTASMYSPIIDDDLYESVRGFAERTPAGLLVRYGSELSRQIFNRICDVKNVRKAVDSLTQLPTIGTISKRRAKVMAEVLQTLSATLE